MRSNLKVIPLFAILLLVAFLLLPMHSKSDVNNLPGHQKYPSSAISPDGIIYVVYQDDRNSPDESDLYLAKSLDGGLTFNDPLSHTLVYDDGLSNAAQDQPSIYIDSSEKIHVVFVATSNHLLFYTKSTDGGNSFSPLTRVDDAPIGTSNIASYPNICVDDINGNIYVGWRDGRASNAKASYAVSTDNGSTFSETRYIVNDLNSSVNESAPSLAIDDSGTLFASWHDNSEGYLNVFYAISRNFGESFEPPESIDSSSWGDKAQSSIAVDSMGRVFISYAADDTPDGSLFWDNQAIAFAYREFNGTFESHKNVTTPSDYLDPEIEVLDDGEIFIMFTNLIEIGNEDVYRYMYYSSSTDCGSSFISPKQVCERKTENLRPSIAPSYSGYILLVWQSDITPDTISDNNIVSTLEEETLPNRMISKMLPDVVEAITGQTVRFCVSVHDVFNNPITDCTVNFVSDRGGNFSSVSSIIDGFYYVDYEVPPLMTGTKISISAQIASPGYSSSGSMARLIISDEILDYDPTAVINGQLRGSTGIDMLFDGLSSFDPGGTIIMHEWDFGDNSSGSGGFVSHAYLIAGVYNVTLTVTDNDGHSASTKIQINVEQYIPEFSQILIPIIGVTVMFLFVRSSLAFSSDKNSKKKRERRR